MHDSDRVANLLGAAALALTDRAVGDATRVAQLSTSSAAAVVTLSASSGLSVSELGRRVGLTQPAAARMVDTLESGELVERLPSTVNRRWVTVQLTDRGRRVVDQLLTTRNVALVEVVDALDDDDLHALDELLQKILTRLYGHVGHAQYLCRLCDRGRCTRTAPCPVGQAERDAET